jgi:hypothetical protein
MRSKSMESQSVVNLIEVRLVNREDYVPVHPGDATRCVDDRKGLWSEDEILGVQMPGASEHPMDLMLLAIVKSGQLIDEYSLFDMTDELFGSEVAKKYGLKPGVHIDDNHGEISDPGELAEKSDGCGADKVRAEVLSEMGVKVQYEPGFRIREARLRGWNVQVLTGAHAGTHGTPAATAAINETVGTTLNNAALLGEGRRASFNHDIWVINELLPDMAKILRDKGFGDAAGLLEKNGVVWSEEMYVRVLQHLGQTDQLVRV